MAHEAYLRLSKLDRIEWQDRAHFFAAAAGAMRRILVDHAAARRAQKRGGAALRVELDFTELANDEDRIDEVLALNDALERLAAVDPRVVRTVECRVFMGMTTEGIGCEVRPTCRSATSRLRFQITPAAGRRYPSPRHWTRWHCVLWRGRLPAGRSPP